jgi:hypothetical protein
MVAASLIATIEAGRTEVDIPEDDDDDASWSEADGMGGEEVQYLNGEFPVSSRVWGSELMC